ncbi:MAG: undecaprenyl-diphosphate phosphatase [Dethiobacter sp.]|nr:undecaprenyl-diphosphate phosphatase [Dethiobacter sp.]
MGLPEGILLGILQGLTEFLPVSSSGHLVIFQDFFGVRLPGITFEVMVHFGTLLSVFWVFGGDILRIVRRFTREEQERRFALMLVLGIIPTGLMGLLLGDAFRLFFESTLLVGVMLLVTGFILYTLQFMAPGTKGEATMRGKDALLISFVQGLAIMPGISRSGSTIAAALWCGLDRETAVRFSFLVSVPVILGVTLLEFMALRETGFAALTAGVWAGTLAAFLSGVLAIKVFVRLLQAGRFRYFSYYCWSAGTVTVVLKLAGF